MTPLPDLEPAGLEATAEHLLRLAKVGFGYDIKTADRVILRKAARYLAARTVPEAGKAVAWEPQVADLIRSISEWDDRTSPEDYPDHLLLTPQELTEFARSVATIASTPAAVVKPLEWEPEMGLDGDVISDAARCPFGMYTVERDTFSAERAFEAWGPGGFRARCPTEAGAFAAAQTDYEQRILAALEQA